MEKMGALSQRTPNGERFVKTTAKTLFEVAREIARRLMRIFLQDEANHQTGWIGTVATLIEKFGRVTAEQYLAGGNQQAFVMKVGTVA